MKELQEMLAAARLRARDLHTKPGMVKTSPRGNEKLLEVYAEILRAERKLAQVVEEELITDEVLASSSK